MPDEETRGAIFGAHQEDAARQGRHLPDSLASMSEGYTGAEIENVVREAGMNAIRAKREIVTKADFEKALDEVRPAIPKELADRIKRFKEEPENMYR
jgi:transitional endoplasmic reticulum ATPase